MSFGTNTAYQKPVRQTTFGHASPNPHVHIGPKGEKDSISAEGVRVFLQAFRQVFRQPSGAAALLDLKEKVKAYVQDPSRVVSSDNHILQTLLQDGMNPTLAQIVITCIQGDTVEELEIRTLDELVQA